MKKLFIFLLIPALFFTGCATENKLALKEKCAGYLETERERYFDEEPEWLKYSEKLDTCVSKWRRYGTIMYYDVLSNENIKSIRSFSETTMEEYEKKQKDYESSLRLL
jgi:hypothetical protein